MIGRERGLSVGRKHVATLMKKMGIAALYHRTDTSKLEPANNVFPYLLRPVKKYADVLSVVPSRFEAFGAVYLIVALGVDAYVGDPAGEMALELEDFSRLGEFIASLRTPKIFVFEGGYKLQAIGDYVARMLVPSDC